MGKAVYAFCAANCELICSLAILKYGDTVLMKIGLKHIVLVTFQCQQPKVQENIYIQWTTFESIEFGIEVTLF